MRPAWPPLEQRRGLEVWRRSRQRFDSAVAGPRFEELVRDWASLFASPDTLGGFPGQVGRGVLTDPATRRSYELDLLVLGEATGTLLAIGEPKWGRQLGMDQLHRLERAREVLARRPGLDGSRARLLLTGLCPGPTGGVVGGRVGWVWAVWVGGAPAGGI